MSTTTTSSDDDSDDSDVDMAPRVLRKKNTIKKATNNRKVQIQMRPMVQKGNKKTVSNSSGSVRATQVSMKALSKRVLTDQDEGTLLEKLFNSYTSSAKSTSQNIRAVCSSIIKIHNTDPNQAQCSILNLLFRSVGGNHETSLEDSHILEQMDNEEWAKVVTDLVDQMRITSPDKILLQAQFLSEDKSQSVREYRKIYQEFWEGLAMVALEEGNMANNANTAKDSSDDDESNNDDESSSENFNRLDVNLTHEILLRVTELVSVGQPDVRAAATVASLHMSHSLVIQSKQLHKQVQVTTRQLNSASGKTKKQHLQILLDSQQRTHDSILEILQSTIIQGVFTHRYRDSNPYIRYKCLELLSSLVVERPDKFLNDQYLKYFGWLMSDKSPQVRQKALEGMTAPFLIKNIDVSLMEHVLSKFLPRIADCVLDLFVDVQEKAMSLLLILLKKGFLDDVDNEHLWNQINFKSIDPDTSSQVRKEALYFVMEQLEVFDEDPISNKMRGSTPSLNKKQITQRLDALASWLAHVLTDGPISIHNIQIHFSDFLIESLRNMPEHSPLVCGSNAINAMLDTLERDEKAILDGMTAGDRVDVAKQRVLVRILSTAVKLEVTNEENSRGKKKKNRIGDSSQELSTFLLKSNLPSLLNSFQSDTHILSSLTQLPQYLDPHTISLPPNKTGIINLLKSLKKIYLLNSDEVVLGNIASSLQMLEKGNHARTSNVKEIIRDITQELEQRILEFASLNKEEDEDGELITSNKRKEPSQEENDEDTDTDTNTNPSTKKQRVRRSGRISIGTSSTSDQEQSTAQITQKTNNTTSTLEDIEYVLSVNLKRFRILLGRVNLMEFMKDPEQLSEVIVNSLHQKLEIRCNKSIFQVPSKIHKIASQNVNDGLRILLCLIAWRVRLLQEDEDLVEDQDPLANLEDEEEEEPEPNSETLYILNARTSLIALIESCFEQYLVDEELTLDDNTLQKFPKEMVQFSSEVQISAGKVASDLRTLFPKQWQDCKNINLRELALLEDGKLIGGFIRFFRSQEDRLKVLDEDEQDTMITEIENSDKDDDNEKNSSSSQDAITNLLYPLVRSIATNWSMGNRREAGVALSHITGSSLETSQIISCLSKILKKIGPVRLLEAHMASLRQSYEDWMDNEPTDEFLDDPTQNGNRPTDEMMTQFQEQEELHQIQFEQLEFQAGRLSGSLGVGSLRDPKLPPALLGFMKEGIRFAFTTGSGGGEEDELVLGSRLSFLALMAKYAPWIRKVKTHKKEILKDLIQREKDLREHPEFEEVHQDDLACIPNLRVALGERPTRKAAAPVSPTKSQSSSREDGDSSSIAHTEGDDETVLDEREVDSVTDLHTTVSTSGSLLSRTSSSSLHSSKSGSGSFHSRGSRNTTLSRTSSFGSRSLGSGRSGRSGLSSTHMNTTALSPLREDLDGESAEDVSVSSTKHQDEEENEDTDDEKNTVVVEQEEEDEGSIVSKEE